MHVVSSDVSCFQGLLFCPEASSLLLHNFCIYHISPPGHEVCNFISWSCTMVLLDSYLLTVINVYIVECYNYLVSYHLVLVQELLQLGAAAIDPDYPILSADDLADQIAEVLNFLGWVCSSLISNFFPFCDMKKISLEKFPFGFKYWQFCILLCNVDNLRFLLEWTDWK